MQHRQLATSAAISLRMFGFNSPVYRLALQYKSPTTETVHMCHMHVTRVE